MVYTSLASYRHVPQAVFICMQIRIDIPSFHAKIILMISRPSYLKDLSKAVKRSPIVSLLGPRQCGKTTLAQLFSESKPSSYFDLESQPDLRRLQTPELILGSLRGIVILDEIQEMPQLFRVLRVVADRP